MNKTRDRFLFAFYKYAWKNTTTGEKWMTGLISLSIVITGMVTAIADMTAKGYTTTLSIALLVVGSLLLAAMVSFFAVVFIILDKALDDLLESIYKKRGI